MTYVINSAMVEGSTLYPQTTTIHTEMSMNTELVQHKTLKEIVTEDFAAAAVFEHFSLDFCCRGGITIDAACKEKGIDPDRVLKELQDLNQRSGMDAPRFAEWEPDFLIDYIIRNHHSYVRKMLPVLTVHTKKIAAVHGTNHPEVIRIAEHFEAVALELQQHMKKEEEILFPYIIAMYRTTKKGIAPPPAPFGSVDNPIRMMEAEHERAGDELYSIRSLSNGYTPPADGCTTFRVTYQELQDFERDLHQHVHLENNILFPMAKALELKLSAAQQ